MRRHFSSGRVCASLAAVAISIAGCTRVPASDYLPRIGPAEAVRPARVEYSFGVLPLSNAVHLFDTYQPLIDEVNSRVSGFTLRLETARDHPSYEMKARNRKLHFVMMNSHLVLPTEEKGYAVIGRTFDKIRGVILVRKGSNIRSARDLVGASISLGSRGDLPGDMMPKLFLGQNGLDVDRQANPKYVGSPESAILNVSLERSSAACVSDSAWQAFRFARPAVAKSLEVRWVTAPLVGLGILVRKDVPRAHVQKVAEALFNLNESGSGRAILDGIGISSFVPANDASYDPVWEFLNDYRRMFGFSPSLGGAQ